MPPKVEGRVRRVAKWDDIPEVGLRRRGRARFPPEAKPLKISAHQHLISNAPPLEVWARENSKWDSMALGTEYVRENAASDT